MKTILDEYMRTRANRVVKYPLGIEDVASTNMLLWSGRDFLHTTDPMHSAGGGPTGLDIRAV